MQFLTHNLLTYNVLRLVPVENVMALEDVNYTAVFNFLSPTKTRACSYKSAGIFKAPLNACLFPHYRQCKIYGQAAFYHEI